MNGYGTQETSSDDYRLKTNDYVLLTGSTVLYQVIGKTTDGRYIINSGNNQQIYVAERNDLSKIELEKIEDA